MNDLLTFDFTASSVILKANIERVKEQINSQLNSFWLKGHIWWYIFIVWQNKTDSNILA